MIRAAWWWATELVPIPRALALALITWAALDTATWIVSHL